MMSQERKGEIALAILIEIFEGRVNPTQEMWFDLGKLHGPTGIPTEELRRFCIEFRNEPTYPVTICVRDKKSGEPLSDSRRVNFFLMGGSYLFGEPAGDGYTNLKGEAHFDLPAGAYLVEVVGRYRRHFSLPAPEKECRLLFDVSE